MNTVTIIVPIYNVEKYLKICFDSLLKQTYQDFIVMAVNDGSSDHGKEIMDDYEQRYPDKFVMIHKENGGYGSVLEMAIAKCTTPYFLVCDPDDSLTPNALEQLVNKANISGSDITIGAKTLIYENSDEQDYDASYNQTFCRLKPDYVYHMDQEEGKDIYFVNPSPHAKLYRTELAKSLKFVHKVGYTDNLLFYLTLIQSKKVLYTDQALAYYLINRTGNSMQDVSSKAMFGQIKVFLSILEQSQSFSAVPAMFYYRMFESFKFMLYQTKRLNCDKETYTKVLEALEEFVLNLGKYRNEILPLYKHYTVNPLLEKMKDQAYLSPVFHKLAYKRTCKQLLKEFQEQ